MKGKRFLRLVVSVVALIAVFLLASSTVFNGKVSGELRLAADPDPWDVSWVPTSEFGRLNFIASMQSIIRSPAHGGGSTSPLIDRASTILHYCLVSIDGNPGGINPAFAMAMFRMEANFARDPESLAYLNKNPGNLICTSSHYYGEVSCNGRFGVFASWREGIKGYAWLLTRQYKPGGQMSWNCPDIPSIIYIYAPPEENDTEEYIRLVTQWTREYQAILQGSNPPPICTCGGWQNRGCGEGGCGQGYRLQVRSCNPAGCYAESQCVRDTSCDPQPAQPDIRQVSDLAVPSRAYSGNQIRCEVQIKNYGSSSATIDEIFTLGNASNSCGAPEWKNWDGRVPFTLASGAARNLVFDSAPAWGNCLGTWSIRRVIYKTSGGMFYDVTANGFGQQATFEVVAAPCLCTAWQDQGCGEAECNEGYRLQTRTCIPEACLVVRRCVRDTACDPSPSAYGITLYENQQCNPDSGIGRTINGRGCFNVGDYGVGFTSRSFRANFTTQTHIIFLDSQNCRRENARQADWTGFGGGQCYPVPWEVVNNTKVLSLLIEDPPVTNTPTRTATPRATATSTRTWTPTSTMTPHPTPTATPTATNASCQTRVIHFLDWPPSQGKMLSPITFSGWAIDTAAPTGTGISGVQITLSNFPLTREANYGLNRPDIAQGWGERYRYSGYQYQISLSPGPYSVLVQAVDRCGQVHTISRWFQIVGNVPTPTATATPTPTSGPRILHYVDSPQEGVTYTAPFNFAGWTAMIGGGRVDKIEFYMDFPRGWVAKYGEVTPNQYRADLPIPYRNSGWTFRFDPARVYNGWHEVYVYAYDSRYGYLGVIKRTFYAAGQRKPQ